MKRAFFVALVALSIVLLGTLPLAQPAAAVMTDAAICYSFTPPAERGKLIGVWDELDKGTENQPGWLGQPRGPAMRLATGQTNLLAGEGRPITEALLRRFQGTAGLLLL